MPEKATPADASKSAHRMYPSDDVEERRRREWKCDDREREVVEVSLLSPGQSHSITTPTARGGLDRSATRSSGSPTDAVLAILLPPFHRIPCSGPMRLLEIHKFDGVGRSDEEATFLPCSYKLHLILLCTSLAHLCLVQLCSKAPMLVRIKSM